MAQKITSQEFEEKVLGGSGAILVDFYADWCGPCKMLSPIVAELAEEGYQVYSVNVDEERNLAAKYGIMSIPTLLFFKDGQKMEELVGLTDKANLKEKLDYYSN